MEIKAEAVVKERIAKVTVPLPDGRSTPCEVTIKVLWEKGWLGA